VTYPDTKQIINKIIVYVLARWEEPSTWAGTGIVSMAIIAWLGPSLGGSIITALAAVGGVLAIVLPEKK